MKGSAQLTSVERRAQEKRKAPPYQKSKGKDENATGKNPHATFQSSNGSGRSGSDARGSAETSLFFLIVAVGSERGWVAWLGPVSYYWQFYCLLLLLGQAFVKS